MYDFNKCPDKQITRFKTLNLLQYLSVLSGDSYSFAMFFVAKLHRPFRSMNPKLQLHIDISSVKILTDIAYSDIL